MTFTLLDWSAIFGYLAITLLLGLYFRRSAEKSTEDYFVSGRTASWWLAGTSMVATTFAADTPLLVAGLVYTQGIAGNWLWWAFLPSGMMTVFLFARLWRRSGLMTDVQFAEMRYAGKPAAFLRGFRAIYLGLLMNCLILGWVTKAMIGIVSTTMGPTMQGWPLLVEFSNFLSRIFGPTFSGPDGQALVVCIFFLIPFTGIYVTLGGLTGVLWTDLFQFVLKMSIVIGVAYYAVKAAGGMGSILAKIDAMRATNGGSDPTALFPDFSRSFTVETLWTLPVITFGVYLGVQWWAFWYPGAEPGGGGYIAQRARRTAGAAFGAVVQHRALRAAAVAVDSDGACGGRAISGAGASGDELHDGGERSRAARAARRDPGGISGGVHVDDRDATQLGKLLSCHRFLSPFREARCHGAPLRARVSGGHRAAGDRDLLRFGAACVDSVRMASGAASGRGHGERVPAALVLVAHQRVERNYGDDYRSAVDDRDSFERAVANRSEPSRTVLGIGKRVVCESDADDDVADVARLDSGDVADAT
jgi:hypothetical protein